MSPARESVSGIDEFGPYYMTDSERNHRDASRGGYFVVGGRMFHWYHQSQHARLGKTWKGVDTQIIQTQSRWPSRDDALDRARKHLSEISGREASQDHEVYAHEDA